MNSGGEIATVFYFSQTVTTSKIPVNMYEVTRSHLCGPAGELASQCFPNVSRTDVLQTVLGLDHKKWSSASRVIFGRCETTIVILLLVASSSARWICQGRGRFGSDLKRDCARRHASLYLVTTNDIFRSSVSAAMFHCEVYDASRPSTIRRSRTSKYLLGSWRRHSELFQACE